MMDLSQHAMLILVAVVAVTALALSIAAYVKESDPGTNSVATDDIQDGAVTSVKIADGTIATADLADDAVTYAKLDNKLNSVSITTATRTLLASESGTLFRFNRAAGIVVTLPAATTANIGLKYSFLIETLPTGVHAINTASTSDLYLGHLVIHDSTDPTASADVETLMAVADGTDDDSIDLGQVEQGWLVGGRIELEYIAANRIFVNGTLAGEGTLATPFE